MKYHLLNDTMNQINPELKDFFGSYAVTLKQLEKFKTSYSAHDLKEALMYISEDDMKQVLGREYSSQMWDDLTIAMEHLYNIPDSHLSALIEFHKSRQGE